MIRHSGKHAAVPSFWNKLQVWNLPSKRKEKLASQLFWNQSCRILSIIAATVFSTLWCCWCFIHTAPESQKQRHRELLGKRGRWWRGWDVNRRRRWREYYCPSNRNTWSPEVIQNQPKSILEEWLSHLRDEHWKLLAFIKNNVVSGWIFISYSSVVT